MLTALLQYLRNFIIYTITTVCLVYSRAQQPRIQCDFFMSLTCDKCHKFLCNIMPQIERTYPIQFITHLMFFDHASFFVARLLSNCTNEHTKRTILQILFQNLSDKKPHIIKAEAVANIRRTYRLTLSPPAYILEMKKHYQQRGIVQTPTFHINGHTFLNAEDLCRYLQKYFYSPHTV